MSKKYDWYTTSLKCNLCKTLNSHPEWNVVSIIYEITSDSRGTVGEYVVFYYIEV